MRAVATRLRGGLAAVAFALVCLLQLSRLSLGFAQVPAQTGAAPSPPASASARPIPLPPTMLDPSDLVRFRGATIAGVEIISTELEGSNATIAPPTVLKKGGSFDPAIARAALQELLASGNYADGRVSVALTEPGFVRVTFRLMPRKIIELLRLDLHGATFERDELIREADLTEGGEVVLRDLPTHGTKIEAYLQKRGFPAPVVTLHTRPTDDPRRIVVLVDVATGVPRNVGKRTFLVAGREPEPLRPIFQNYTVKVGDRADDVALVAADLDLEGKLRARGYHRATVEHVLKSEAGVASLFVTLVPGPRIVPHFEGNDHYDDDALTGVLDLEDETDRSPPHLVTKLKDFYVKRGFYDAEVTFTLRDTVDQMSTWLMFSIAEHARVSVAARAYPCFREKELGDLQSGGPKTVKDIGTEIDSFLEEELPGAELLRAPDPRVLDGVIGGDRDPLPGGARPHAIDLTPRTAFAPDTYERALAHVQELYRAEGYLDARVGPVQVVRRRCDRRSPPGRCIPVPLTDRIPNLCTYSQGLPLPVEPLDGRFTCVPDPLHNVVCEPQVGLVVPVKLGPRTELYDASFVGAREIAPARLLRDAKLDLGKPVSTNKLDEARRRVLDLYKEEGFAFAQVKYSIEQSPDHTRGRARFEISESERVFVRQIIVRGNVHTNLGAIMRRVTLEPGKPYRASEVRKTEERIATLGVFSSVTLSLEDPYVPEKSKIVIITVSERERQYTELAPGFSTGEGFRLAFEYGHRNLSGNAIALTFRVQVSYIPTPFIIDPVARENYDGLTLDARLGTRITAQLAFPEIGLGALVRSALDGIAVHDLQRDFYITKLALIPSVTYKPVRDVGLQFSQSVEYNVVRLFAAGNIDEYLQAQANQQRFTPDLARQLLVPDGASVAYAQRFVVTWDRRDNAFNATRGTYLASGIEHVDAYPQNAQDSRFSTNPESHFLRFTQTFGTYIPLPRGMRIAALLRLGHNLQLTQNSQTYPDRLFFLGGVDSMRGYQLNAFLPQDDADRVEQDQNKPSTVPDPTSPSGTKANPDKFTAQSRPVRGGNFMVNPRLELRIPIKNPVETVLFTDIGNLWVDPTYPFDKREFPMRASVGTGLRLQTPVGPLAFDYGINVTRRFYEDFGSFHFAIGLF